MDEALKTAKIAAKTAAETAERRNDLLKKPPVRAMGGATPLKTQEKVAADGGAPVAAQSSADESGVEPKVKEYKTENDQIATRYTDFQDYILKKLPNNKINVIVSHSSFIQEALKFPSKNKLENLDAILVVYKKDEKDEKEKFRELTKYRIIYKFIENELELKDGVSSKKPPEREGRQKINPIEKNDNEHQFRKASKQAWAARLIDKLGSEENPEKSSYSLAMKEYEELKKNVKSDIGLCNPDKRKKIEGARASLSQMRSLPPDTTMTISTQESSAESSAGGRMRRKQKNKTNRKNKKIIKIKTKKIKKIKNKTITKRKRIRKNKKGKKTRYK